ncbi:hypothetical protein SNE40_016870 [Patella caerulea]|uniref:Zinc-hook domain-containing protein n=1 Tax=Patella caerulea TaxID=87958 RepID=A0AAN8J9D2_PATCE
MSMIEKMSIQGIRSFGPDDQDRQVMQFFKPLTLILGPNGTGKTTVIECLKYMTTGDLPPGGKGGAFIHDPKIAHEREVKGQIRLQIRDVTGKQVLITKSMLATQKVKKVEMRTLEGVITRHGPDGEKKSINSRCADMDREMVSSLGVSKAVLENVIFCHQEDSNWPLSEGKPLKEKFDAIFASTRYTKVLETIRKLKQEQDGSIKIFREELKYLKERKEKALQIQADVTNLEVKYSTSQENVAQIEEELSPLQEKLQQLGTRAAEIFEIKSHIQSRQTEQAQVEKAIADLLKNIENEFQGSTEDLKRLLSEFQDKVEERQDKLAQYERKRESVILELEKTGKKKSSMLVEVGRLDQEAEGHKENIRKRDTKIVEVADNYSFEGYNLGNISDEKYKHFFEEMKNLLETKKAESKSLKAQYEEEEEKLQKKLDNLKESKTKLESNERLKREMMTKNSGEIRQINQKLSNMEVSAGRLDHITTDLKRAEQDLTSLESNLNLEDVKREIAELDKTRKELNVKISDLNTELNKLTLESNVQAEVNMYNKDKVSKEDNIRRLKAKHEDTINYLLGDGASTQNLRGKLEDFIIEQGDSVKHCSEELQNAQRSLSSKEAQQKMLQQQLRQKEDELRKLDDKILTVCGSQNYDDEYQNVQQKLTQTQESRGSLLGAEHFFKQYVTDLEKTDPCCPLCHRGFETEEDVRQLILELQDKLRRVPSRLNKAEKDLEEYQTKYDNMTQLKPLRENITTLNDISIPDLKTKLKKLSEEINELKERIQDKTDELQAKENDEGMAKSMQPDVLMIDRYQGELRELERKIATKSAMLSGGVAGRTIEVVVEEKGDKEHTLDNLNKTLDHKRQKMSDHTEKLQRLKTKVHDLKSEKLQITSELQQRTKLEESKISLISDNKQLEDDIKDAREEIKPLETQITRTKAQKDDVVKEKEGKIESANQEVEHVKTNGNLVKSINAEIKRYNMSGKADELERCKLEQRELEAKVNEKEIEQTELTQNINKLNKDLSTQKVRERELNDNLQLRKKKLEVKQLAAEIEENTEKLGGVDLTNIERERRKLLNKEDALQKERHTATGRLQGLKDQIKSSKKELESPMYKDASEKYRDKVIDMRTTELSNKDLEKYYKAMDRAIMNYHNQKMKDINKIIRELWRNTYKGNGKYKVLCS